MGVSIMSFMVSCLVGLILVLCFATMVGGVFALTCIFFDIDPTSTKPVIWLKKFLETHLIAREEDCTTESVMGNEAPKKGDTL